MLDSADDILPAALKYLGLDPNSSKPEELEKGRGAGDEGSSECAQISLLGIFECACLGRDLPRRRVFRRHQAGAEPRGGSQAVEVGYAIPKEGAQLWFDNLAIPKDARNVAEAHAFIDYMMKPEVAAKNSNFIAYANGNLPSQKLLDKAVLEDPGVYPPQDVMDRLYTNLAHDAKTKRLMNRLWTKVKTGNMSGASPPTPVKPKPLFRVLPDPSFNDGADDLHGRGDVDFALCVARLFDCLGQVDAETVSGQPHHAGSMDRTIDVAREPSHERIGLGPPTEESHVDAPAIILIDQHAGVSAAGEFIRDRRRSAEIGRHEQSHPRCSRSKT